MKAGKLTVYGLIFGALLMMPGLFSAPEKNQSLNAMLSETSSFSSYISEFRFNHSTPDSGTFTAKCRSTGALKTFQDMSGTFESKPISFSEAIVTTAYTMKRGNLELTAKMTAVVDIVLGSYRLTGGQMTVADTMTGKTLSSLNVEADGSFNPANFNSLVVKATGTF